MNKSARAVPPALLRAGITHAVDNVPAGAYVGGFETDFVRLFRNEIIKKLFKGGVNGVKDMESIPAIAGAEGDRARADDRGPAGGVPALHRR